MNMLDMKKLFFLVVGATFLHALEAKIDCSLVRCARPVGCEGRIHISIVTPNF